MNKLWLASLVVCGAAALGCQSGQKGECCGCKTAAAHAKVDDHEDSKEETIAADKVPAAVMNGFKKAFPGATIEKVEKETYADGTVHYEFEFKGKDGKKQEIELNDAGEVLEEHD